MATTPGEKVLRIGVLRDGHIAEERTLAPGAQAVVGRAENATIVLSGEGVPATHTLFANVGGRYVLRFTDQMHGRVSVPAGTGELAELVRSGHASASEGIHQVELDGRSRGRIGVGGVIILFQFVEPEPVAVRPVLPQAVMAGSGSVDWNFAAFVNGAFLFLFGFGLFISQLDPVVQSGIQPIPEDLVHLVIDEPPEPEVPTETPQDTTDEPAEETPAPSESRTSSNDSPSRDSRDVTSSAEAQASLADDVANQVMNELLGANSSDSAAGIVSNVLAGGTIGENLGDMLSAASGTGVASGSGSRAIREAGGGGGSGTTAGLGTIAAGSGPRASADTGGDRQQVEVRRATVRSAGSTAIGGTGTFDTSQVTARLRGLQASLNRCYEQELATNPNLEGRVGVQFTIMEAGSVSGVQVDGGNGALQACVSSVLARLRFNPGPVGGSVRYSTSFVFSSGG